jgi:hypothetical protein
MAACRRGVINAEVVPVFAARWAGVFGRALQA